MNKTRLNLVAAAGLSLALAACAGEGGEDGGDMDGAMEESMAGDMEPVDERTTDGTTGEDGEDGGGEDGPGDRTGPEDRTTPEENLQPTGPEDRL